MTLLRFFSCIAFLGHTAGPKADIWVAFAGPLTHLPMVLLWLALLASATYAATGTAGVALSPLPYPDTPARFYQTLSASAVLVRGLGSKLEINCTGSLVACQCVIGFGREEGGRGD